MISDNLNNIIFLLEEEAQKAFTKNEVPISCVIVDSKNNIIAKSHNLKESSKQVINHAEIIALNIANKKFNNWRLNDCIMYVSVEPCLMCYSAAKQARIKKIYYFLESNFSDKTSNFIPNNSFAEKLGDNEPIKKIMNLFFEKMRKVN